MRPGKVIVGRAPARQPQKLRGLTSASQHGQHKLSAAALRHLPLAQLVARTALEDTLVVALSAPLHGILLHVLGVNLMAVGARRNVRVVLLVACILVRVLHGSLVILEVRVVRGDHRHVSQSAVARRILARLRVNRHHGGLRRRLVRVRHALVGLSLIHI